MINKTDKKFNYAVGFYWEGEGGSVGLYTYFNNHFFGTMAEAKKFREYCQTRPDNKGKSKKDYKIFILVEVPE